MGSEFGFEYDCLKGTFYTCSVCNYAWRARTSGSDPRSCPSCGTRLWKKSFDHVCTKCSHIWTTSHSNPHKCPRCQSTKWSEGAGESGQCSLSPEMKGLIMTRYRAGSGAVKISMETGITFSDVFEVIRENEPDKEVLL